MTIAQVGDFMNSYDVNHIKNMMEGTGEEVNHLHSTLIPKF